MKSCMIMLSKSLCFVPKEMLELEVAILYIMEKEEGSITIELIDAIETFKKLERKQPKGYSEDFDEFMDFDLDSNVVSVTLR